MIGRMALAAAFPGFNDLGRSVIPARRVKLWSLNANVFFKEPYQLTNFT